MRHKRIWDANGPGGQTLRYIIERRTRCADKNGATDEAKLELIKNRLQCSRQTFHSCHNRKASRRFAAPGLKDSGTLDSHTPPGPSHSASIWPAEPSIPTLVTYS